MENFAVYLGLPQWRLPMSEIERIELRLEDIIEEVKEIHRKVDEIKKILLAPVEDVIRKLAEQEVEEVKND